MASDTEQRTARLCRNKLHEMTGDNLILLTKRTVGGRNVWLCRACREAKDRLAWQRRKQRDHLDRERAGIPVRPPNGQEKRTHCYRGHEFTKDNVINTKRGRTCRTCRRRSWRKYEKTKRVRS